MSGATPIVIVEPNGLLRAVLRGAFGGANGWTVLASLDGLDQSQLIRILAEAEGTPLLLCGVEPDDDLVPALTEMRQRFPGLAVALLGPMPTMPLARQILAMIGESEGGFVYLEHERVASVRDIEAACRVASSGRAVLDMPVLLDLAEGIAGTARAEQRPADDETLLAMLADGMTDDAIAIQLDVPLPLLLMWLDDLYERIGALHEDRDPRVYAVVHYLTQTSRAPLRLGREGAAPVDLPLAPLPDEAGDEPPAATQEPSVQEHTPPEAVNDSLLEEAADINWTPRESTVSDEDLEELPLLEENSAIEEHPEEPDVPHRPTGAGARGTSEEPVIIEIPPRSARARRADRQAEPLDDEQFLQFARYGAADDAASAQRIVVWAREHHLTCRYGTGRREGSFTVTDEHGSLNYWLLTVWAAGSVEVEFGALRAKAPFSSVDARNELAERLRKVPGVEVREADLHGRVRLPLSALSTDGGWRVMREALDWAVEAIRDRAA